MRIAESNASASAQASEAWSSEAETSPQDAKTMQTVQQSVSEPSTNAALTVAHHAACPACGASSSVRHGSVKGRARHRCQRCFKIFFIVPKSRRAREDAYAKWLADIAS